jgi:hypothetical protein
MKTVMRAGALGMLCIWGLGLSGQGCQRDDEIDLTCTSRDDVFKVGDRVISCAEYFDGPGSMPPVEMDAGPDVDAPDADSADPIAAFEYHSSEPSKPPPALLDEHPADPPGPKDPEAVVKAGIFTQSCIKGMYYAQPRVNRAIFEMYNTVKRDPTIRAFFERSGCFKNKANGCDAVVECLGYKHDVYEVNEPLDTLEHESTCIDGIRHTTGPLYFNGPKEPTKNIWFNCKALGLECYEDREGDPCSTVRAPCDPAVDTQKCDGNRPYLCSKSYNFGKYYNFEQPDCSDFGMSCINQYYCAPQGPACTPPPSYSHDGQFFSYGVGGIACDSPTKLRVCMDGYEATVDCPSLADGLTCIPGAKPRCGFADECDLDGLTYCEGDSVVLCDAGKVRKVDCKSLGFTGCNPNWGVCSPGIYDYY